jgi:hypothetical protein
MNNHEYDFFLFFFKGNLEHHFLNILNYVFFFAAHREPGERGAEKNMESTS